MKIEFTVFVMLSTIVNYVLLRKVELKSRIEVTVLLATES